MSILGLQSVSWDTADNVTHPRRLEPTIGTINYSFVIYLQHGGHGVVLQTINRECCAIYKSYYSDLHQISGIILKYSDK